MSDQHNANLTLASGMGFGSIFFIAGALIVLLAADIIPADPSSFNAPRWVVGAAGLVFMLAGFMVALQGAFGPNPEESKLYLWIFMFIGPAFLILFASIFIWVGFGPGERAFTSTTSVGMVSTSGSGSQIGGRIAFGSGGIIALLMTFLMIRGTWKKIRKLDE